VPVAAVVEEDTVVVVAFAAQDIVAVEFEAGVVGTFEEKVVG
jgi:hypothetical protein